MTTTTAVYFDDLQLRTLSALCCSGDRDHFFEFLYQLSDAAAEVSEVAADGVRWLCVQRQWPWASEFSTWSRKRPWQWWCNHHDETVTRNRSDCPESNYLPVEFASVCRGNVDWDTEVGFVTPADAVVALIDCWCGFGDGVRSSLWHRFGGG